jgi:hypothetical protein
VLRRYCDEQRPELVVFRARAPSVRLGRFDPLLRQKSPEWIGVIEAVVNFDRRPR